MRANLYYVIGFILVTIVGLLGIAACLHVLISLPIRDNKGPEWLGAIGTVGTLAGTIWLATADKRDKRIRAIDNAYVTIVRLQSRLAGVKHSLQTAVDVFSDEVMRRNGFPYELYAKLLNSAGNWDDEDILPLIELPNRVCARLAQTKENMATCVRLMKNMQENQNTSWMQAQKDKADAQILACLIQSRDTATFCLQEFEVFRKKVESF
jgi:hypothetical protein